MSALGETATVRSDPAELIIDPLDDTAYRRLARRDLRHRLGLLNQRLRSAVERQMIEASGLDRPDISHMAITDRHAGVMLDRVDRFANGSVDTESGDDLEVPQSSAELDGAAATEAIQRGWCLPFGRLRRYHGLDDDDVLSLVACTAPEIDAGYHRLYAFVLDDLRRTAACPALLAELLTSGDDDPLAVRSALGPYGALRHSGLVVSTGEATTDLLQELRLAPGLLELLLGAPVDLALVAGEQGRSEVQALPVAMSANSCPPGVDLECIDRLGRGLAEHRVEVVGVWGGDEISRDRAVCAMLDRAGFGLDRLELGPATSPDNLRSAVNAAALSGHALWLIMPDYGQAVQPAAAPDDAVALVEFQPPSWVDRIVAATAVTVVLSGSTSSHPRLAMGRRAYTELRVGQTSLDDRRRFWRRALPLVGEREATELAGRYRLGIGDIETAAALAETTRSLGANNPPAFGDEPADARADIGGLVEAVATVARSSSERFSTIVTPERRLDELVLPEAERTQIVEIGRFHRAWPAVIDGWGFGRRSGRGVKALFVGEPGTGKTMAAEVIANELEVALVKVDLAQVVSKWVGETEKNLELAFGEAEASDCVLFFDEADSLFGKRGEVRHGTDRYANLEVGYLLQRLENYEGLVVLASNLQDNIDAAFGRRFHFVVHFPRPTEELRRQLWDLAFPPETPVADLDTAALARLDLTGAGIASTAQTAALLAADEGAVRVDADHVVLAAVRQFQREGRALRPSDLGRYASLV